METGKPESTYPPLSASASLLVCNRGARAITNSWYPGGGIVPKLEKTKCGKENGCARPAERDEKVKLINNSSGGRNRNGSPAEM